MVLCIYRPPRSDTTSYLTNVEEELNGLHSWTLSQRQILVTLGDLNLDRLKPESAKESEKRTPLISPENGRKLSEKREST